MVLASGIIYLACVLCTQWHKKLVQCCLDQHFIYLPSAEKCPQSETSVRARHIKNARHIKDKESGQGIRLPLQYAEIMCALKNPPLPDS